MKSKKIIAGIIAIVLVTAIFIISEMMADAKPAEHRVRMFPEIEERHITGFSLTEQGKGVVISKENGTWMVAEANVEDDSRFPADSASVQIAIEKILAIRTTDLISENPDKRESFEVDSVKGMTVKIRTIGKEDNPFVAYVGKSGPEWNSNYIRREGMNAVYLLRGGIKYSLSTDVERWKKVVPEPDTSVSEDTDVPEIEE